MNTIYLSELFKIMEDTKTHIFIIEFAYSSQILINSLIKTKIIKGSSTSSDYKTLKFKASSVKTFREVQENYKKKKGTTKFQINDILKMSKSLISQLNYLIQKENRIILGYSTEDIFIINENQYVYMNSHYFSEIYDNQAIVSYPITDKNIFGSPELLKIRVVPSYIHYKSCYYSFGCLLLYALSDNDYVNNYVNNYVNDDFNYKIYNNQIEISKIYQSIKNTKIYWLIKKCLHEEPENRCILLI